jgi:hypothetical protein
MTRQRGGEQLNPIFVLQPSPDENAAGLRIALTFSTLNNLQGRVGHIDNVWYG